MKSLLGNTLLHKYYNLIEKGYSQRRACQELNVPRSTMHDLIQRDRLQKTGKGPKILFLDIETAAAIAAVFGRKNIFLTQEHIVDEGGWLLCAAWKWNYENKVKGICLDSHEAIAHYDHDIITTLQTEINKADAVVAHYGNGFDFPMLRTRMAVLGLDPLLPTKFIDTKAMASRIFRFPDNRLHTISSTLGLGGKLDAGGIDTWYKAQTGDRKALQHLYTYCKHDVELLEGIYWAMSSFGNTSTFNAGRYFDDGAVHCINCGSTDLYATGKIAKTLAGDFPVHRCEDCGAVQRGRDNTLSKENRKLILTKVPVTG